MVVVVSGGIGSWWFVMVFVVVCKGLGADFAVVLVVLVGWFAVVIVMFLHGG